MPVAMSVISTVMLAIRRPVTVIVDVDVLVLVLLTSLLLCRSPHRAALAAAVAGVVSAAAHEVGENLLTY